MCFNIWKPPKIGMLWMCGYFSPWAENLPFNSDYDLVFVVLRLICCWWLTKYLFNSILAKHLFSINYLDMRKLIRTIFKIHQTHFFVQWNKNGKNRWFQEVSCTEENWLIGDIFVTYWNVQNLEYFQLQESEFGNK